MIKKGWIALEGIPGTKNRKNIVLTDTGRLFCETVIGQTRQIEQTAFSKITETERKLFISLFRKTNQLMREEYEKRRALEPK